MVLPGRPGPVDARALRTAASGSVRVTWTSLDLCGSSSSYDVVRGTLSALRVGFPAGAACAANNVTGTQYDEAAAACPAPAGDGFWYLARAQNSAGTGTYADARQSVPHPIDGAAGLCP